MRRHVQHAKRLLLSALSKVDLGEDDLEQLIYHGAVDNTQDAPVARQSLTATPWLEWLLAATPLYRPAARYCNQRDEDSDCHVVP